MDINIDFDHPRFLESIIFRLYQNQSFQNDILFSDKRARLESIQNIDDKQLQLELGREYGSSQSIVWNK